MSTPNEMSMNVEGNKLPNMERSNKPYTEGDTKRNAS